MNWWIVLLRFLHIFAGVFWAGGVFVVARFINPVAADMGQGGQEFMRRLMLERGLTRGMLGAGAVTVVAGLLLMWHDSAGMNGAFMKSGTGVMLGIGALAALGALFTGIRSAMLASRFGKLMAEAKAKGAPANAPQLAEAQALGATLSRRSQAVAVQLAISVLCMAVARYVVF